MAATPVQGHTPSTATTSGSTLTPATSASGVAAGNLLAMFVTFDNTGTTTPTVSSITKPGTETASWTKVASFDSNSASAAGSVRGEIWVLLTTVAWPASTSFTVTLSAAVQARGAVWEEFSGVSTTVVGTAGTANSATTTSATTTGTAPASGDLVLAGIGIESSTIPAADTDTLNGSWDAGLTSSANPGTNTSSCSARLQWKIPSASGHQTINKANAVDGGCCIVNLAAVVVPVTVTIGQAVETDTAQPVTAAASVTIGQAVETDTAQPVTAAASVTIGQAVETDTAQPILPTGVPVTVTIGQAVETDTAQPITPFTPPVTVTIGQAVETDTAQPITATLEGVTGRTTRRRRATLTVIADPPIDAPPADLQTVPIYRDSWHVEAPTVVEGWKRPKQETSRLIRSVWGRYRVVIAGGDRTFFRGLPVQVVNWSHATPFGPETCVLRFEQISPFEKLGVDIPWLHDHAKLSLHRIKEDGTRDTGWHWNGIKHTAHKTWTEAGWVTDVEFKGFLHQGTDANNRPTLPAGAQSAHDIGHRIPHRMNQVIGRKFAAIPKVVTGIEQWKKGALSDSVLAFVAQLLSIGWTADGVQWSLMDRQAHPWQAHMVLPDPDTVDYTLALGTSGLQLDLDEDNDEQPNVVYGEWITPDGYRTQNLKYPHLRLGATPIFPLGVGESFAPGDAQPGFGPFARWLARNGWTIYSDDTYDARDEAEVKDAQDRLGVTEDGLVNVTTWGTAFVTGTDNAFEDAVYLPIAWDKRVEPYLWTPDGEKIGKNPDYDPTIPRREIHINFGENIHRADVIAAARQIVALSKRRSLVGTIRTSADPEECSLRDMRAGKTLAVPYLDGTDAGGVKFHVARVEVTEASEKPTAELTVDTLWRDKWTVTKIIERNREARHNPARMRRENASGLTQDTKPVFDKDNGAGQIEAHPLDAGVWRVIPFAAGAWGTFIRIHMETDPITEFALVLFAGKVTSNFCARYIGDPLASSHPYKPNASTLKDAGLIDAWGSQDQPCGYSKPGASDGYLSDDDPVTGAFEWDSAVKWWSERTPLLYLAEWSPIGTSIEGRFYDQPVDF